MLPPTKHTLYGIITTIMFEVLLSQKKLDEDIIRKIFAETFKFVRQTENVTLSAVVDDATIKFYLDLPEKYSEKIPSMLPGIDQISLRRIHHNTLSLVSIKMAYLANKDLLSILHHFHNKEVTEVAINGHKFGNYGKFSGYLIVKTRNGNFSKINLPAVSFKNLSIDFNKNPNYLYTKTPKYLNLEKSLQFFSSEKQNAIFQLESYPYFSGNYYLPLSAYDFTKHTLVVGASGSGKTKFLSTFIKEASSQYHQNVRLLVIDPHDALRQEIGGLPKTKVFDFSTTNTSINLFNASSRDIIASIDTVLSLIKTLIGSQYNAKLERLARASIYTLVEKGEFSFHNLKKLLTDSLYRNQLIKSLSGYLPESIENFFGQSFNELKTASYNEAFSPLIAFIDELQLLPAFYRETNNHLKYEISKNLVTLISLNQSKLGEKAEKTIAGLILNQIFVLMNQRAFSEHLIIVIDEVAVIETPILVRFLSEARKFNVSLVLAGQYYAQISPALIKSISANVANYFCFRTSYEDAELLADNLNIKLSSDFVEDKYRLLASLPARHAVMRLSQNSKPATAIMGKTLDFIPSPELKTENLAIIRNTVDNNAIPVIDLTPTTTSILDIMREQSASRKKVNEKL